MNILIIQAKGEHPPNWVFREALNLQRAFVRLGEHVVVWGKGYANFKIPFEEISKDAHIIILLENYDGTGWLPPGLTKSKKLKMFWSIDSHCILDVHKEYCKRFKIDVLMSATQRYVDEYVGLVKRTIWLPNAYPADLIYPNPSVQKKWNLGFCGNYANRKPWIDELVRRYGMKTWIFNEGSGLNYDAIGYGMVKAIQSCRVHFNRNLADDINYRTFETLGCKTLLFTNYTPDLDRLFKIGEHLVVYDNLEDLDKKYRYYIDHPEEIEKIAEAGYQHVSKEHTYYNRAETIRGIIQGV